MEISGLVFLLNAGASAKEAEEGYRWVRRLMGTVYDMSSSQGARGKRRQTVANLFVGDWIRLLKISQREAEIKFVDG